MSPSQKDYLSDLLSDHEADGDEKQKKRRRSSLLSRATALDKIASGQVYQVTHLRVDPKTCRIWPGNGRYYNSLNQQSCQDLIDSLIAENAQRVPAIARRITGESDFEYEIIAGSRRHWSVSWLRRNHYPEFKFLIEVHDMDDESAFRLADLENRARKDLSDFERARNYQYAIENYYGGIQSRMAERLKLSRGWLSKMLKVAAMPDELLAAFFDPSEIQFKPCYELVQLVENEVFRPAIFSEAKKLAAEQVKLHDQGKKLLKGSYIVNRLTKAAHLYDEKEFAIYSSKNKPLFTVTDINRNGAVIKLHSSSGASEKEIKGKFNEVLLTLRERFPNIRL